MYTPYLSFSSFIYCVLIILKRLAVVNKLLVGQSCSLALPFKVFSFVASFIVNDSHSWYLCLFLQIEYLPSNHFNCWYDLNDLEGVWLRLKVGFDQLLSSF